jgi:hypothetical protein
MSRDEKGRRERTSVRALEAIGKTLRSCSRQALVWVTVLGVVTAATATAVIFTPPSSSAAAAEAVQHPDVNGAACTSCKAPQHDYVHSAPYEGECSRCHVTTSWNRVSYSHVDNNFNLGFHQVVGCSYCHTAETTIPSPACEGCHRSMHPRTPGCPNCHTGSYWSLPKPLPEGHVSLSGGHEGLVCFNCHVGKTAFTSPKHCVECHGVHHGGLTDCGRCHDPAMGAFKLKAGFTHTADFPLTGEHGTLGCAACHSKKLNFTTARPVCVNCHGVHHGGLTDCARCHTTKAFIPSKFWHSWVFALTGEHATLACTECHPGRRFASAIGEPNECVSCHGPHHGGLTDCAHCHNTTAFKPPTFRHYWVFRLVGQHRYLACTKCHPGRRYAHAIGQPDSCVSCHGPHHGGLTDCASCHTPRGFQPPDFKHSSVWPLTGKHAELACTKCHPGSDFAHPIGSPDHCTNCHGVHHGNQTECEKCHTTAGFKPSKKIEHPVFPALGGEHAKRSCSLCHPGLNFSSARPCNDCHTAPHVGPTDCLRCHRPTVWTDIHFHHADIGYHTQYPIEDACPKCHTEGDYTKYVCDQCHIPY